jgi:hypothetical protein
LFGNRRAMFGIDLPLDDHPSYIPIKPDKLLVDRLESFVLRGSNALLDLGQKARIYF